MCETPPPHHHPFSHVVPGGQHGQILSGQILSAYFSEGMALRTCNWGKYASGTDVSKQDHGKQDAAPKRRPKENTSERGSCQLEAIKRWKPTARLPL